MAWIVFLPMRSMVNVAIQYPGNAAIPKIRAAGQGFGTSVSRIGAILGLTAFPAIVAMAGLGSGLDIIKI